MGITASDSSRPNESVGAVEKRDRSRRRSVAHLASHLLAVGALVPPLSAPLLAPALGRQCTFAARKEAGDGRGGNGGARYATRAWFCVWHEIKVCTYHAKARKGDNRIKARANPTSLWRHSQLSEGERNPDGKAIAAKYLIPAELCQRDAGPANDAHGRSSGLGHFAAVERENARLRGIALQHMDDNLSGYVPYTSRSFSFPHSSTFAPPHTFSVPGCPVFQPAYRIVRPTQNTSKARSLSRAEKRAQYRAAVRRVSWTAGMGI